MPTIYKLTIGMAVLVLLLMSFLPTPRNPMQASASARLAFPLGAAGGYLLGGDELGRDVLSRLMSGGRFLAIRLLIVGAILAGLTLLVRRRLARRAAKRGAGGTAARRLWAVTPTLVMIVTFGVALSVVSEAAIGLFGRPDTLEYLGPVGNVLLGTPREPPAPSWGGMLVQARPLATQAPWLLVFPAAGLLLVAAGLVLFGSGVVDVLRQRARRSG